MKATGSRSAKNRCARPLMNQYVDRYIIRTSIMFVLLVVTVTAFSVSPDDLRARYISHFDKKEYNECMQYLDAAVQYRYGGVVSAIDATRIAITIDKTNRNVLGIKSATVNEISWELILAMGKIIKGEFEEYETIFDEKYKIKNQEYFIILQILREHGYLCEYILRSMCYILIDNTRNENIYYAIHTISANKSTGRREVIEMMIVIAMICDGDKVYDIENAILFANNGNDEVGERIAENIIKEGGAKFSEITAVWWFCKKYIRDTEKAHTLLLEAKNYVGEPYAHFLRMTALTSMKDEELMKYTRETSARLAADALLVSGDLDEAKRLYFQIINEEEVTDSEKLSALFGLLDCDPKEALIIGKHIIKQSLDDANEDGDQLSITIIWKLWTLISRELQVNGYLYYPISARWNKYTPVSHVEDWQSKIIGILDYVVESSPNCIVSLEVYEQSNQRIVTTRLYIAIIYFVLRDFNKTYEILRKKVIIPSDGRVGNRIAVTSGKFEKYKCLLDIIVNDSNYRKQLIGLIEHTNKMNLLYVKQIDNRLEAYRLFKELSYGIKTGFIVCGSIDGDGIYKIEIEKANSMLIESVRQAIDTDACTEYVDVMFNDGAFESVLHISDKNIVDRIIKMACLSIKRHGEKYENKQGSAIAARYCECILKKRESYLPYLELFSSLIETQK